MEDKIKTPEDQLAELKIKLKGYEYDLKKTLVNKDQCTIDEIDLNSRIAEMTREVVDIEAQVEGMERREPLPNKWIQIKGGKNDHNSHSPHVEGVFPAYGYGHGVCCIEWQGHRLLYQLGETVRKYNRIDALTKPEELKKIVAQRLTFATDYGALEYILSIEPLLEEAKLSVLMTIDDAVIIRGKIKLGLGDLDDNKPNVFYIGTDGSVMRDCDYHFLEENSSAQRLIQNRRRLTIKAGGHAIGNPDWLVRQEFLAKCFCRHENGIPYGEGIIFDHTKIADSNE